MTIEQRLYQILSPLVPNLFPISAPIGTDPPYTVYERIGQEPMTTQEGSVTSLQHHLLQFVSFGSPGAEYAQIDARTQTIMDTLLPLRDAGIQSITLLTRQTHYDTHYKLDASILELEVMESLGA